MDHSQPVWRHHRGLPKRAIDVLRALVIRPFPPSVSNWFINVRVWLWKPMIEEIRMLETKWMSGMDLNSSNINDGKLAAEGVGQPSSDKISEAQSNKLLECHHFASMLDEGGSRAMEQWNCEKRSRIEECAGMDGRLMSLALYPGAMDVGRLRAVSISLGM